MKKNIILLIKKYLIKIFNTSLYYEAWLYAQDFDKWLCCHKWTTYKTISVSTDMGGSYYVYILICEKCGKIKKVKSNNG